MNVTHPVHIKAMIDAIGGEDDRDVAILAVDDGGVGGDGSQDVSAAGKIDHKQLRMTGCALVAIAKNGHP